MKNNFFAVLFLFISSSGVYAQMEATTGTGKRVLLNNDGTWKFVEEGKAGMQTQESFPVVHFEVGCKDLATTTTFYSELFGWSPTSAPLSSIINTNNDAGIQGHITALGHEPHNYVTFYIQVTDIVSVLKNIEAKGGKKIIGPFPLPDKKQFAWFKDPEGNMVGLITK